MSSESERQRIQHLATLQPHLLGEEFTALQFPSRVAQKDIGKPILYRDFSMRVSQIGNGKVPKMSLTAAVCVYDGA